MSGLDLGREWGFVARALVGALVMVAVTACMRGYALECGPLDLVSCDARADEIEVVVTESYPGRTIRSIEILNEEGHATVVLDDGAVIGFGERLSR